MPFCSDFNPARAAWVATRNCRKCSPVCSDLIWFVSYLAAAYWAVVAQLCDSFFSGYEFFCGCALLGIGQTAVKRNVSLGPLLNPFTSSSLLEQVAYGHIILAGKKGWTVHLEHVWVCNTCRYRNNTSAAKAQLEFCVSKFHSPSVLCLFGTYGQGWFQCSVRSVLQTLETEHFYKNICRVCVYCNSSVKACWCNVSTCLYAGEFSCMLVVPSPSMPNDYIW